MEKEIVHQFTVLNILCMKNVGSLQKETESWNSKQRAYLEYIFKKKSIQLLIFINSSSFTQLLVIHTYVFFLQFKIFNGFPVLHLEIQE